MLHAVVRKKMRLMDAESGIRRGIEDAVTSTLFGPLSYLPFEDRLRALEAAIGTRWNELVPDSAFKSVTFEFWPQHQSPERSRYVEPDLHVTLQGSRSVRILVEIKWDAVFGEDQLLAQWRSIPAEQRHNALHLIILRNRSYGEKAIVTQMKRASGREKGEWDARLVLRSWHDIAKSWSKLSGQGSSEGLAKWASDAAAFLYALGIVRFMGFVDLLQDLRALPERALFSRPPWFASVKAPLVITTLFERRQEDHD
jgi:hypothetical protein